MFNLRDRLTPAQIIYRYSFTNEEWTVGKWKTTSGEGELCSNGWLHCYDDLLLAELHNPTHGNYEQDAKLWKVEVDGKELRDGQMKSSWTRMRLIEEIKRPTITTNQRVAYGILCAKQVYKDKKWTKWTNDWLSGKDRSEKAAADAHAAAHAATFYAANAANAHAFYADAAASAAYAAAYAAADAAADAANAHAFYADAAASAAYAAAFYAAATYAATAAAWASEGKSLNLIEIAKQAMKYK